MKSLAALMGLCVGGATLLAASNVTAAQPRNAQIASVPNPTVHYTFDSDLIDARGGSTITVAGDCATSANPCNSQTSFGSDENGKYWTWTSTNTASGGGFTLLTNSDFGISYTVALKFSFSQVSGWRKIIDYRNRTSDEGFYYFNGKMQFYPGLTGNEVYPVNTVLDLVIVRQGTSTTNGTFTVYGVGANNTLTQLIQYNDTNGGSLPFLTGANKNQFGFFYDDTYVPNEATMSGKVYDLRIWNSALDVQTLESSVLRPATVTGLVANPATQSIIVSWDPVPGATSYVATGGGQVCTATAPATSCTLTGLSDGNSVSVSVQAVGPGGYSAAATSQAVTVGATTTTTAAATTTTTVAVASTTTAPVTTTVAAPVADVDALPSTGATPWVQIVAAVVALATGAVLSRRWLNPRIEN